MIMKTTVLFRMIALIYLSSIFPFTHAKVLVDIKGNGHVITKEIPVPDYTEVKIGGNINSGDKSFMATRKKPEFNYSQATGPSTLQITTDENLLSHLDIRVSKGCLIINTKKNERLLATRLDVIGQSATLENAIISGTFQFVPQTELDIDKLKVVVDNDADVRCTKSIRVNSTCTIKVNGVGKMLVEELICPNIKAEVNDAGELNLKGEAQIGKYSVTGVGKIKAYNFKLENLECKAGDSAHIQAHVTDILKACATDAGGIKYKGFPRADIHNTAAGKVKRIK